MQNLREVLKKQIKGHLDSKTEALEIEIGEARLKVFDRDARCSATTASPATGKTDVDVPKLLHSEYGHTDFGVYAQVVKSGPVRLGDPVRVV